MVVRRRGFGSLEVTTNADYPLLLKAAQAARLLGRSERSVWRDHAKGLIPAPVRLGGTTMWRRDELFAWVAAGCPPRAGWDRMAPSLAGTRVVDHDVLARPGGPGRSRSKGPSAH